MGDSPVYGVIFLFKYPTGPSTSSQTDSSKPLDGTFDYDAAESDFFAAQVIQNACGTQALLSVLMNHDRGNSDPTASHPTTPPPKPSIDIGTTLRDFKDFTITFPSSLRGEALSNSELIRDAHNSFARSSPFIDETARPDNGGDAEDVYHFIAYTPMHGTLYELDGLQPAPISHGPCAFADFGEKVIPVLQRRVARYPAAEIRFNLLALCGDLRARAREVGDWEGAAQQEARRREWAWENALRRHNFLGFAGQLLREVVRGKLAEGGGRYEAWVEAAKGETERKWRDKRARREAGEGGGEGGGGGGDDGMDLS